MVDTETKVYLFVSWHPDPSPFTKSTEQKYKGGTGPPALEELWRWDRQTSNSREPYPKSPQLLTPGLVGEYRRGGARGHAVTKDKSHIRGLLNSVGARGINPHTVENPHITLIPKKLNYWQPTAGQKAYLQVTSQLTHILYAGDNTSCILPMHSKPEKRKCYQENHKEEKTHLEFCTVFTQNIHM